MTLPIDRTAQVFLLGQRDGYAAAIALSASGMHPPLQTAMRAAWKAAADLVTNWEPDDVVPYEDGFARAWERSAAWMQNSKIAPSLESLTIVAAQRDALLAQVHIPSELAVSAEGLAMSGWEAFRIHVNMPNEEQADLRTLYMTVFAGEFAKKQIHQPEASGVTN